MTRDSEDELERLLRSTRSSIERNFELLNAPTDHALLAEAQRRKGHISLKAVGEEYDRLVWRKLHPDDARVHVDVGEWRAIRGSHNELDRSYEFENLAGLGSRTVIDLRCRLVEEASSIKPFVYLVVQPHLLEQTKIVTVMFAPTGELMNYKFLSARLEKSNEGKVSFLVFDISDGGYLLNILMLGRRITLHILRDMPPFEWLQAALQENAHLPECDASIAHVPLENDSSFRIEYEALESNLRSDR